MDFESYLGTEDALRQTESAQGTVLHPGQVLDGMRVVAFLGPAPKSTLTATNAIERQFQKMFAAETRRYPVYIQGKGTLKCPDLTFCEVHLASGVTFITTGRFKPDGYAIKEPVPPPDADWDNRIGYPAYVVEQGAKLVFTDNDAYPSSMIRR